MADSANKVGGSVDGKYYVDEECIACDACIGEAPDFFEMNDDEGYAFVKAQPSTPEETEQCEAAIEACPVEAIGNNG